MTAKEYWPIWCEKFRPMAFGWRGNMQVCCEFAEAYHLAQHAAMELVVVCSKCKGTLIYKRTGNVIEVFHSCNTKRVNVAESKDLTETADALVLNVAQERIVPIAWLPYE